MTSNVSSIVWYPTHTLLTWCYVSPYTSIFESFASPSIIHPTAQRNIRLRSHVSSMPMRSSPLPLSAPLTPDNLDLDTLLFPSCNMFHVSCLSSILGLRSLLTCLNGNKPNAIALTHHTSDTTSTNQPLVRPTE